MAEWKEGEEDNSKVMVEDTGWIMLPLTELAQRKKIMFLGEGGRRRERQGQSNREESFMPLRLS